jgi:hypothetical protein
MHVSAKFDKLAGQRRTSGMRWHIPLVDSRSRKIKYAAAVIAAPFQ